MLLDTKLDIIYLNTYFYVFVFYIDSGKRLSLIHGIYIVMTGMRSCVCMQFLKGSLFYLFTFIEVKITRQTIS